jgi:serine/threonine-protein kinase
MKESSDSGLIDYPQKPKTVPPANVNRQRIDANGVAVQRAKNIPVQKEEDKSGKKKVIALSVSIVCVLLFLIIIFIVNLINGNWTLGVGKKMEVDNFVGLNYEQQIKNNPYYEDRYNFQITYQSFSDGKDGEVFRQDPEAGTMLPEGSTIHLFIAKSGEGIEIPDFRGQEWQTVRDKLESMGFIVDLKTEDSTEKAGTVLRTDPAAGSSAFPGSSISV